MQFTLNREAFFGVLKDVCHVVERNQTLPILSNILIKLNNHILTCVSTDLEIEITSQVKIESDLDCAFTLPARKIFDIVKALPKEIELTIQVNDKKAIISTQSSRYTFALLSEKDFPLIQEDIKVFTTQLKIPALTLKKLIESTQFCMAVQDIRYYLNGLFIRFNGSKILAVATDGHRLAKYEVLTNEAPQDNVELLLPRKSIAELSRILPSTEEEISIEFNQKLFSLKLEHYNFISKLIDSDYPDYQRVYPKLETAILTVDRLRLKEALSRVLILTNKKTNSVKLNISTHSIEIYAHNPEQEEAKEQLEVEYQGSNMELGFNVSYFIDILNHLNSEKIEILLSDADSSCIIKNQEDSPVEYVLMPIKF